MEESNGHNDHSQQSDNRNVKVEDDESIKRENNVDEDSTVEAIKDETSDHDTFTSSAVKAETNGSLDSLADIKAETKNGTFKSESKDTNGHAPPTSRAKKVVSKAKKPPSRVAPLFDDYPDVTEDANSEYQVIDACIYENKYLGLTEHAMECDCVEDWDASTKTNRACDEDSDCINRATKMECVGDCTCGAECQNQRFWRRLYANVSIIKTEKKGYGLRANTALKPGDFIFEYIGEVIREGTFRKRMRKYDDEGIKHFYFMSLSKGEFVDATKRGNMGRFCNHSCNPNCYVDKWVVGDKLRMGIFAEKHIKSGEELVFNYNVDRYGANPQPCYCGEDNCTGFIGGKTQTERGTKLSAATIEALGIDDEDWDAWDTMVAKKTKKKKTDEDYDEDYAEHAEARDLDVKGVTKVMAALMQCKEKWIAVKLLQRIQRSSSEDVMHRIVRLHGYKIFNSQLSAWREDENVVLQILEILQKLPRITRNKISDAGIDTTLEPLKESTDERVSSKAVALLDEWSKLEMGYRIPRKARGATDTSTPVKYERRDSVQVRRRSRSKSRSISPPRGPSGIPRGPAAPSGPRAGVGRPLPFSRPSAAPFNRGPPPLPTGWFQASDQSGRTYFYTSTGETTWKRPSQPATSLASAPKQPTQQDMLKSIIDGIVGSSDKDRKDARTATPDTPDTDKRESKEDKWKKLDEEKQKKLYENTLFPHISHVMNKYKHKVPKEDLKRFAKDVAKKLVNSDFKAGRVENPTKISDKHQKKVKSFCKDYFDKAASKHKKMEDDKKDRKLKDPNSKLESASVTPIQSPKPSTTTTPKKEEDDEEMKMSDIEDHADSTSPMGSSQNGPLKRKRSFDMEMDLKEEEDLTKSPAKRLTVAFQPTPPPPPPPAPPIDTPSDHNSPAAEQTDSEHLAQEPDVHADTNFRDKSMADVQALAQMDAEDDEVDWGMEEDTEPIPVKVPI